MLYLGFKVTLCKGEKQGGGEVVEKLVIINAAALQNYKLWINTQ